VVQIRISLHPVINIFPFELFFNSLANHFKNSLIIAFYVLKKPPVVEKITKIDICNSLYLRKISA